MFKITLILILAGSMKCISAMDLSDKVLVKTVKIAYKINAIESKDMLVKLHITTPVDAVTDTEKVAFYQTIKERVFKQLQDVLLACHQEQEYDTDFGQECDLINPTELAFNPQAHQITLIKDWQNQNVGNTSVQLKTILIGTLDPNAKKFTHYGPINHFTEKYTHHTYSVSSADLCAMYPERDAQMAIIARVSLEDLQMAKVRKMGLAAGITDPRYLPDYIAHVDKHYSAFLNKMIQHYLKTVDCANLD